MGINFTMDDVTAVANCRTLGDARQAMIELINRAKPGVSKRPMNPRKISYLTYQVQNHRTVEQIVKLGVNMVLAGEGQSMGTGTYQTIFKSWKY